MNDKLTTQVLFQILSLAPMGDSAARFQALVEAGNPVAFWKYYESCLHRMPELDAKIEKAGQISFRMLKPAMEAVFMGSRSN
jgi:hypothetical protein